MSTHLDNIYFKSKTNFFAILNRFEPLTQTNLFCDFSIFRINLIPTLTHTVVFAVLARQRHRAAYYQYRPAPINTDRHRPAQTVIWPTQTGQTGIDRHEVLRVALKKLNIIYCRSVPVGAGQCRPVLVIWRYVPVCAGRCLCRPTGAAPRPQEQLYFNLFEV